MQYVLLNVNAGLKRVAQAQVQQGEQLKGLAQKMDQEHAARVDAEARLVHHIEDLHRRQEAAATPTSPAPPRRSSSTSRRK